METLLALIIKDPEIAAGLATIILALANFGLKYAPGPYKGFFVLLRGILDKIKTNKNNPNGEVKK